VYPGKMGNIAKGRALKVLRKKNGKFDDEKTTFQKQQSSQ
jgi:hypothetical protein